MLILIRADASLEIGSGHVMRCLALASALRAEGAAVHFICRDMPGHMIDAIKANGHAASLLPRELKESPLRNAGGGEPEYSAWLGIPYKRDAEESLHAIGGTKPDLMIVDHYGIDHRWHCLIRPHVGRIMAIDDLANRRLDCDHLLDQTFGRDEAAYRTLVPKECRMHIGARFALLRTEFSEFRERAMERRRHFSGLKRILVSMGGVDAGNLTKTVLEALDKHAWKDGKPIVDLVLGTFSPHLPYLKKQIGANSLQVNLHVGTTEMAALMLAADLAIGAGGTTSWERCALGLPSLITILAENQRLVSEKLSEAGAVGIWRNPQELESWLSRIAGSPSDWIGMHAAATGICDGMGASRMAREIMEHAFR